MNKSVENLHFELYIKKFLYCTNISTPQYTRDFISLHE